MLPDPIDHPDWQIARAAEKNMRPIKDVASDIGIAEDEIVPFGKYMAKIDYSRICARIPPARRGKYIDVTAITPTPLGEGKSTTTIGLVQGLAKKGVSASAAIRQPSGGPTMNIKGSAAGGGLSLCIPLTPFSLGFTGDINALVNAHNLAMVALTSRMHHEFNYTDSQLSQRGLRRLDIDPSNVRMGWIIDFCAQSLRKIIIGMGGRKNGVMMESRFDIAVSSEIMAILAIASDLKDLRQRIGRIVVASDRQGNKITTEDLEVAGAMTAWLVQAIQPNLIQTVEGQPVFVHAGPFANIAIGQSSVIADKLALRLSGYHVTESGFGADIGFEKFWNLKCRVSGFVPDAAVIVATIRGLKCHGGAPIPVPGKPVPAEYFSENVRWVEKGTENLLHCIAIVKRAGVNPVICLNHFSHDTKDEVQTVRRLCEAAGARVALSQHWRYGGDGAQELADAVIDACAEPVHFRFLYDLAMPHRKRIEMLAHDIYGAEGVDYAKPAMDKFDAIDRDERLSRMGTCMVKTHLSLSDNPLLKGVPKGWNLLVRDVLIYEGAGLVVPVAGDIKLMPGTSSNPAFRRIDVDTETGDVTGLF